jgi:hypothetical protein
MDRVHDTRRPAGVKQWKHELELLRSEIGRQHDHVIERMREDETRLLEALYSVAESDHLRLAVPGRGTASVQECLTALEHCLFPIVRRLNSLPAG